MLFLKVLDYVYKFANGVMRALDDVLSVLNDVYKLAYCLLLFVKLFVVVHDMFNIGHAIRFWMSIPVAMNHHEHDLNGQT